MKHPIVIAIDGTSASGKSTNAKLVAKALSETPFIEEVAA